MYTSFYPTWTSGGQSIIFETERNGTRDLYQYTFGSGTFAFNSVQTSGAQTLSVGGLEPILSNGGQGDVQQDSEIPICIGQVIPNASPDVNLRQYPNFASYIPIITTLEAGTGLIIIETTIVDQTLWWHVSIQSSPELEGYVFSNLVDDFNNCQSQVPQVPPPQPPQPQANEICIVELNGNASVYDGAGAIINTFTEGNQIQVYGMNRNRERYLVSLPGNSLPQQWINVSIASPLTEHTRGCDRNALGRFRETTDQNYWNAVGVYANNFQAPIASNLFTSNYADFRNSFFYDGVSHEGTDLVYRPPSGTGNALSFDVYTMASGVVVDAGPDGITRAYRYQKDYCPATEPPANMFEGIAGVFYFTSPISCPNEQSGFRVQYFFAMMFNVDGDNANDGDEEPSTGAYEFGLTVNEITNLLEPQGFILSSNCNNLYGCIEGPGRRLIIWYDTEDNDLPSNLPEMQTVFYHVNISSSLYPLWNNQCSDSSRLTTWTETIMNNNPNYNICRVNAGILVGQTELIGFTTGIHLHQEIHIDRNNDGIFPSDGEDEDPLMAFQTIR